VAMRTKRRPRHREGSGRSVRERRPLFWRSEMIRKICACRIGILCRDGFRRGRWLGS
jgi:hypothetical protein